MEAEAQGNCTNRKQASRVDTTDAWKHEDYLIQMTGIIIEEFVRKVSTVPFPQR
jgi:hypothetical protein